MTLNEAICLFDLIHSTSSVISIFKNLHVSMRAYVENFYLQNTIDRLTCTISAIDFTSTET